MEQTRFVCYVYVLQIINDDDIVVELCDDVCFVVKPQCVVCDVDFYLLWSFALDGKG